MHFEAHQFNLNKINSFTIFLNISKLYNNKLQLLSAQYNAFNLSNKLK